MFSIPVISPDLSQEETILQITDVLRHLETVTDAIFNRIITRMDENSASLNDLDSRIEVTRQKVEVIKDSVEGPLTITAEIDCPERVPRYVSCLEGLEDEVPPMSFTEIPLSEQSLVPVRGPDVREVQEKLQFYHVKPKAEKPKDPFLMTDLQASLNKLSCSTVESCASLINLSKPETHIDIQAESDDDVDPELLSELKEKVEGRKSTN